MPFELVLNLYKKQINLNGAIDAFITCILDDNLLDIINIYTLTHRLCTYTTLYLLTQNPIRERTCEFVTYTLRMLIV